MKLVFSLVFLFGLLSSGAVPPILAGVDGEGAALRLGSSWGGEGVYIRPLVRDDGTVLFAAPLSDEVMADSPDTDYRAIYTVDASASQLKTCIEVSGYSNELFRLSATNLAFCDNAANGGVFSLRTEEGGTTAYLSYQQDGDYSPSSIYYSFYLNPALTVGKAGKLLAITNPGSPLSLYQVGNFAKGGSLSKLDVSLSFDGRQVGISSDGTGLFYASSSALCGKSQGRIRIYRRDLNAGTDAFLAEAEMSGDKGQLDAQIVAASDADAFAFVCNNPDLLDGDSLHGSQIVLAVRGSDGYVFTRCGNTLYNCKSPAINADGRYVAFVAAATAGGVPQVYRFDVLQAAVEQVSIVSGKQSDGECAVPAISPGGRLVAFASRSTNWGVVNPGKYAHTWVADMGGGLKDAAVEGLFSDSAIVIPAYGGLSRTETAVFTWEGTLPGEFYYVLDGAEYAVRNGGAFPSRGLPVRFRNDGTVAAFEVNVVLAEGTETQTACYSVSVRPDIRHLSCKEDGSFFANGGFNLNSGTFSASEDGTLVAFESNAPLVAGASGQHIYLREVEKEQTRLMTEGFTSSSKPVLSGDGKTLFFLNGGTLYRKAVSDGTPEALVSDVTLPVAASRDGSVLALIQNGKACRWTAGSLELLSAESGFTAAYCSRSGEVLAFLGSDGLYAWDAGSRIFRLWASGVTEASLSMSGSQAVVFKAGAWARLYADGSWEALPVSSDCRHVTMSSDGRFLVYGRANGKTVQVYRYDCKQATETQVSLAQDGTSANAGWTGSALGIAMSGTRITFASRATNLVSGKPNLLGTELFQAAYRQPENESAVLSGELTAQEDDDEPNLFALQYTDADGNDAIPEITGTVSKGSCELLLPSAGHPWYALRFTPPEKHFCGAVTLNMKIFDGVENSLEQSVTLTVQNVNDKPSWKETPESVRKIALAEGEKLTSVSLQDYAEDPDLKNPEPWTEKITLRLQGAPDWMILDSRNCLVLSPDYEVTTRNEPKEVTCQCLAEDAAGEKASLEITVTVSNTNRIPCISGPEAIAEGKEIPWTAFALTDDDLEDAGLLRLRLSLPAKGRFQDAKGNIIGADRLLQASDFPIYYEANAGGCNSDSFLAYAVDGEEAVSAPIAIAVQLRRVQVETKELWTAEMLPGTYPGWALLSTPIALNASQVEELFGGSAWLWEQGSYRLAETGVPAGAGFWVYLEQAPKAQNLEGDAGTLESNPGWNLLYAPGKNAMRLLRGQYCPENGTQPGAGYWVFEP